MTDETKLWLTRQEATDYLRLPKTFLKDAAWRGKFGPPFHRFTNRTVLYNRFDLERWYSQTRVTGNHKAQCDAHD